MQDNNKNKNYFQLGINGLIVVVGGLLIYFLLFSTEEPFSFIGNVVTVFMPFITGFALAYVLNPIMVFFEEVCFYNLYKKIKKQKIENNRSAKKWFRYISAFLTIVVFLMILYSLIMMIAPQIILNIQILVKSVPDYAVRLSNSANEFLVQYPKIKTMIDEYWSEASKSITSKILPQIQEFLNNYSVSVIGSIVSVFRSLFNFIVGIIIALFLLVDKEIFLGQAKKICYAIFNEKRANNYINNLRYADKIFGGFITGKIIDSMIIGILCYICMLILDLPFAALISVVVGVTNVIPYFGPIIGAIPSAFIVLMVSGKSCLIFIIFILILQQFDGNILGPKILGSSTGLGSFWVIFSITVFSGLFGLIGMFLGVPLFALIYAAFRTYINQRLSRKNMPVSTAFYSHADFLIEDEDNDGNTFRFSSKSFDRIKPVITEAEMVKREEEFENYLKEENKEKIKGNSKKSVLDKIIRRRK